MRIQLTDAEQADGRMCDANLNLAVWLLREVGAVILENAVPLEIVEVAQTAYFEIVQRGMARKARHVVKMPFLHHQFITNPFSLQVIEATMGKKVALFRC